MVQARGEQFLPTSAQPSMAGIKPPRLCPARGQWRAQIPAADTRRSARVRSGLHAPAHFLPGCPCSRRGAAAEPHTPTRPHAHTPVCLAASGERPSSALPSRLRTPASRCWRLRNVGLPHHGAPSRTRAGGRRGCGAALGLRWGRARRWQSQARARSRPGADHGGGRRREAGDVGRGLPPRSCQRRGGRAKCRLSELAASRPSSPWSRYAADGCQAPFDQHGCCAKPKPRTAGFEKQHRIFPGAGRASGRWISSPASQRDRGGRPKRLASAAARCTRCAPSHRDRRQPDARPATAAAAAGAAGRWLLVHAAAPRTRAGRLKVQGCRRTMFLTQSRQP